MSNVWPKKWLRLCEKIQKWSITRQFLKQHFDWEPKQLFASGGLWEVFAYEKWSP